MRFSKLFTLIITTIPFVGFTQDYKPLRNDIAYPHEITSLELHDEVYADSLDKITFKKNEKHLKGFQLSSDFFLKNLLYSGKIIYSGPAYTLVNNVTDEILKGNPIRNNIHVFVLRSTQMNAFTFNNGYIFINSGLLARLENESQLAFILSHEISHYLLKHVFKAYKKSKEKSADKGELEEETGYETMRFSRSQESEADLKGLELIKSTRFNPMESVRAIDLLKNFDKPFENKSINQLLAGAGCFQLPASILTDTLFEFSYNENQDDVMLSHPNLGSRKKSLSDALLINNQNYSDNYTLLFNEVRGNCMAEQIHLYLLQKDYLRAFYNSLLLVKQNPQVRYFRKSLIQSGYYLVRCNNTIGVNSILGKINKDEGEIYRLSQFLRKLNKDEFNVLITGICLRNEISNSPEIKRYNNEIIAELQFTTGKNSEYFKTYTTEVDSLIKAEYNSAEVQNDKHVRYTGEKVMRKKKERSITSFAPYFLCDLAALPAFIIRYDSIFKANKLLTLELKDDNKEENIIQSTKTNLARKESIDKFIFLDAQHIFIDSRGKEPVKFYSSEVNKKEMIKKFLRFAKESNTYVIGLNPENIDQLNSQFINDRGTLINWVEEISTSGRIKPAFYTDNIEIDSIIMKTGVRYVSTFTSGAVIQKKRNSELFSFVIALFYPPLLIPTIYNSLHIDKNYMYEFVIYDLKTGDISYLKKVILNTTDREDVLNAELYNLFYQLHKK